MSTLYVLTAVGFFALVFVSYAILFQQLKIALARTGWPDEKKKKIRNGTLLVIILWGAVLTILSLSGFSGNFELFPFNAAPVLIIPLVGILIITFSDKMGHLLRFIPEKKLVQLQVFRLFVEILLWLLFIQHLLPIQMTFEGMNFDVLSGITAPVAAFFFIQNKKVMILWNLLCLGLLINIVVIALLSMPTPYQVFKNEPANTIVLTFPFILLPGFLVPLAYGLHFLSLRQLKLRDK